MGGSIHTAPATRSFRAHGMLAPMIPLLLAGLFALEVGGSSQCPTPAALSEALQSLLPAEGSRHVAVVEERPEGVRLELRDEHGQLLAERILVTTAPCADRARAGAGVLAAWEAQLSSEPVAVGAFRLPPAPHPLGAVALRVDAGALLAFPSNAVAPGVALAVTVARERWRWGGRATVLGVTTRDLTLGAGRVGWYRVGGGLGARYLVVRRRVSIELSADALAGLIRIVGLDFARNSTDVAFDPGLGAAVRALWLRSWYGLWVEVGTTGWLRRHDVAVVGLAEPGSIPRFDATVALGLSVGRLL
jgi:hypothetical protein